MRSKVKFVKEVWCRVGGKAKNDNFVRAKHSPPILQL